MTSTNATAQAWEDKRYVSGVLIPLSGKEAIMFSKITVDATHKFLVGSEQLQGITITEKDRFIYNNVIYTINYIARPVSKSQHYEIIVREKI